MSLVNQTLNDIEIIVINDGSTDNSLSVLQEYASKDDRIIQGNKKVAMLAGGTFLTATIVALMSACAYVDKKKKQENNKTM